MMFKHFLITRFNVKVDSWNTTKNGEAVLNDEWLSQRFQLFETYCLPSVRNQTNQNFTWCIFFDTGTSQFFKNKINIIAESYSNITVSYIEGNELLVGKLLSIINDDYFGENNFVITTRLDNDDLIHYDFINTIHQSFCEAHNTVIDIRKGYQVCIENDKLEVKDLENKFNPFISLVEQKGKVRTVLCKMHRDWQNNDGLVCIDSKRLWIELVHTKNKLNVKNNTLRNSTNFIPEEFGISDPKFKISLIKKINLRILRIFSRL